jgi:hypothetical protein
LGWAEICHPFHPLRGQRFQVLKTRRVAGSETLLLRDLVRGSFAIARDWTDWADPTVADARDLPPRRLDASSLIELVGIVERLVKDVDRMD